MIPAAYPPAFEAAMAYIHSVEVGGKPNGGYTNDPNDPGGETKYGISKRANPDIDIAALTWPGAQELYWTRYWIPAKCDKLPAPLNVAVLDTAVHNGVGTAIILLQRTLGIKADGKAGPQTLLRASMAADLYHCSLYLQKKLAYNRSLDNYTLNADGWDRRVCLLGIHMGIIICPKCKEESANG